MRLFINISNLVMGGAIQVAHSFISELDKIKSNNNYLICATQVSIGDIKPNLFSNKFKFFFIDSSPAKLFNRFKISKKLYEIENDFNPDLVFTLFGPSYWVPKSRHICGFADGWVYNPKSIVYSRLNFISKIKRRLLNTYKSYRIKKESSHFILETSDAKSKFSKYLNINKFKISVVSNTYNSVFDKKVSINKIPSILDNNSFKLLTVSSYYPNKNLEIINSVVNYIPNKFNIKFYLTLPDEIFIKKFNKSERILNLGTQVISNCPKLYYLCDVMFLPTLLETFSASYLEAMIMNKPIITSNLSFAKDICDSSAEYFNPLDPKDIAKKIINLIINKNRYKQLISLGNKRVNIFPSCRERAHQYLEICNNQINNKIN